MRAEFSMSKYGEYAGPSGPYWSDTMLIPDDIKNRVLEALHSVEERTGQRFAHIAISPATMTNEGYDVRAMYVLPPAAYLRMRPPFDPMPKRMEGMPEVSLSSMDIVDAFRATTQSGYIERMNASTLAAPYHDSAVSEVLVQSMGFTNLAPALANGTSSGLSSLISSGFNFLADAHQMRLFQQQHDGFYDDDDEEEEERGFLPAPIAQGAIFNPALSPDQVRLHALGTLHALSAMAYLRESGILPPAQDHALHPLVEAEFPGATLDHLRNDYPLPAAADLKAKLATVSANIQALPPQYGPESSAQNDRARISTVIDALTENLVTHTPGLRQQIGDVRVRLGLPAPALALAAPAAPAEEEDGPTQ